MRNKIITRGLAGAFLGVFITIAISLGISAFIGNGNFYYVNEMLIKDFGSELNASIIQTVISMLYGALWGSSSCVFETENWSLLKQCVVHLLITTTSTFIVAYYLRWMGRTPLDILIYFSIFFVIYAIIFFSIRFYVKMKIENFNQKIKEN